MKKMLKRTRVRTHPYFTLLLISKGYVTIEKHLTNHASMKELHNLYKPLCLSDALKDSPESLHTDSIKHFCNEAGFTPCAFLMIKIISEVLPF